MASGLKSYILLLAACLALYLPGIAVVPPLDRDESRFIQATRQMLDTGDFIDIRFQDEPRHKKPIGIHWLQAASVRLLSPGDHGAVWAYRVPSLLGAAAAVLLTAAIGALLFGPATGFLAGLLLAATVGLATEALQAKTDAAQLAAVAAAQLALARCWRGGGQPHAGWAVLFWGALGAGILLKGPVAPLVLGLTILALGLAGRRWAWLGGLRPAWGPLLTLAMVAPWLIAVQLATDGAFLAAAVGADLGPKLVSGQESHGAPPGYFLALLPVTFWPSALLLAPALWLAWRRRREEASLFCLAWLVPAWLVFEAVPTKLPHYVLPLFPALALLSAAALSPVSAVLTARWARWPLLVWVPVPLALAVASLALPQAAGAAFAAELLAPVATALAAALAVPLLWWRGRPLRAVALALLLGGATIAGVFHLVLPRLEAAWVAPRLVALLDRAAPDRRGLAVAGYHEPSLVFLAGTATRLTSAEGAAAALAEPGMAAAVEARDRARFEAALAGAPAVLLGVVEGFNYSRGRRVALSVYVRR
ncbi:MAG: glycosyltransferase family 39 protein [Thalassobaculales bacterium]